MGARSSVRPALAALGGLACLLLLSACEPPPPPSVLLVTLDTTRADYIGHLGGPDGVTPHIDALAARSAVFTRARSETNVTNPSHLSIMTGLRALEHGVINNRTRIPARLDTLPAAFRRAGFATAAFVSARHLGSEFGWTGFQVMPPSTGVIDAERTTDLALRWLDSVGDRPFFLWTHYFDPHGPYDPPEAYGARWFPEDPGIGRPPGLRSRTPVEVRRWRQAEWVRKSREDAGWARAMYTAEIAYTDAQLSRLFEAVAARPGPTVVVLTADHGESLGEHDIRFTHRGVYEVSLRIPLLFHVPGRAPIRSDAAVSTLDVAPTVAALAGVELQHDTSGRSLVPILRGDANGVPDPESFVHQEAHNSGVAVRRGRWKLVWPLIDKPPIPATPQLFDLVADPDESVDLAGRHPERVTEMKQALEPWIALGFRRPSETHDLDESALEELRALGYVEP